ncbi:MAG: cache domain-containing protein [Pseudomonadota bacterium]
MKFSLGLLLACCLAGLQFVAITLVVSSSYLSSQRVLLDHAQNLLSDVGLNTSEHAKGFLSPARGAAELAARLAENRIVASEDRNLLEQLLFQQLRIAPQFAGVYYGDAEGGFVYVMRSDGPGPFRTKMITGTGDARRTELIWRDRDFTLVERRLDPEDQFDPRQRPWYLEADAERGSIWTDPYIFFSSKRPGITIAAPVVAQDESLKGVIGVDIEIDAISDFLAQLQIGDSGKALIVNANGDVIAHPNRDLIMAAGADGTPRFVGIGEIADGAARTAFGDLVRGGSVVLPGESFQTFTYQGDEYVSTVVPLLSEELPWTIAVYAPEADFIGAIKENRTQNIWIAAAVALATALFGLLLANLIHKPVRAFAVRAALISQGEIDPAEVPPKTYRELELANTTLMHEIAQRKQTEQEYGQTFDLASRGMVQMEPETGRFTRVNAKFADILGFSPDALLSKTAAEVTHPVDGPFIGSAGRDAVINGERRLIRKDGSATWVNISGIMIRDDEGRAVHVVATIDDINAAKQAEAQIQTLHRDLSHIARGQVLGQMASGLAHELNQPLTAIAQNADSALLTARGLGAVDPEFVETLEDIEAQAHRAGDIIRALRTFARKGDAGKSRFDLTRLLHQSLSLVAAEAKDNGVRILIVAGDLPHVSGVRVQIAQVLVNLMRNAIEAMAGTDDRVRTVWVRADPGEGCVDVAVEDTGPGVPPGADVFQQFETTKPAGMGLGLSICRSIVEAGGGTIWLDRQYTTGGRFVFTVPIAETVGQADFVTDASQDGLTARTAV